MNLSRVNYFQYRCLQGICYFIYMRLEVVLRNLYWEILLWSRQMKKPYLPLTCFGLRGEKVVTTTTHSVVVIGSLPTSDSIGQPSAPSWFSLPSQIYAVTWEAPLLTSSDPRSFNYKNYTPQGPCLSIIIGLSRIRKFIKLDFISTDLLMDKLFSSVSHPVSLSMERQTRNTVCSLFNVDSHR